MTPADVDHHARWHPASGHPGGWRVVRQFFPPHPLAANGAHLEEARGPGGRVRLFRTMHAAASAAALLNAGETKR